MNAVANAPVATPADLTKMNATQLRDLLNDLRNAELDLDDKELTANQKQQAAVIKQIRDLKATRTTELTKIAAAIKAQGFGIKELFADAPFAEFTNEELMDEVKARGLTTGKAAKAASGEAKPKQEKVARVFESDKNPIFIDIPRAADDHQRVTDVVIHQGRTNEFYQGKQIFASIGKPAQRLKGKDVAETEKNLTKFIVKEAEAYAKTEAGKAELKKIAEFVFNYVDPKAK
ncbi:MAG: hypothetical protein GY734_21975 [Herbaspirillum sp.]|uniref:hypothetical protein n=1 Tax=Herbaspirillum sp. TaxID=1890675 RepID=UPI0025887156|nr:hypothetical protein [Herbaspirillum sp.]MCP3658536.1 hypothetical protein [Herbaspirillum sp.]MCP4033889.1 hypothetical protein [Herbaspirillum sp.]